MSKAMRFIVPILIIFGAIAVTVLMFKMKPAPEKKPEEIKALLVDVKAVMKQDLIHQVHSQGTVKPLQNTVLVSEVNGKVVELSPRFIAGGFFNKGDVLVTVDSADYRTTVKTAQANLARAQASLQEEKAKAKVAEVEWNAAMKGQAPDLYLRKPQLARELANVNSAEADLEKANRDLSRTKIRAPFDGMVKQKSADIGQFISRGANLGTLFGTAVAEVRLPLTDQDLAYLDMPTAKMPNKTLKVKLSAMASGKPYQWPATLVRSEGVIDEKSRVTYAVAQLNDPYGLKSELPPLPFGRFVLADVEGFAANDIVKLPRHLLTAENQVLVFVEGKLDIRAVSVVRSDEDYAYIADGLEQGELYITSIIPNPLHGLAIRTVESTSIEKDEIDANNVTAGK